MLRVNLERESEVKNMKLRAARLDAGLTQRQAAEKSEISERIYQEYEYDRCEPGVRTAIRIAKALDTTVESIFGDQPKIQQSTPDRDQAL